MAKIKIYRIENLDSGTGFYNCNNHSLYSIITERQRARLFDEVKCPNPWFDERLEMPDGISSYRFCFTSRTQMFKWIPRAILNHFEKGNYFHLVVKEIDEEFVQKGTLQAIVKRNEWDSTEPLHKSYQSLLGR